MKIQAGKIEKPVVVVVLEADEAAQLDTELAAVFAGRNREALPRLAEIADHLGSLLGEADEPPADDDGP